MDNQILVAAFVTLSVVIGLPLYLAPSIVAFRRRRVNRFPIAILNITLGWTGWGWVGALLWACFDKSCEPKHPIFVDISKTRFSPKE
jgi:hypothetical protein